MKHTVVWLFVLLLALNVSAQAPVDSTKAGYHFSLEQCLTYAFANNYTRKIMLLTQDVSNEVYRQSKYERLPDLSGAINENVRRFNSNTLWTGTAALNTNIILYQGGAISRTIERNKLLMAQAGYQTMQYDNNMVIKILQLFLNALGNKELLVSQEALVKVSAEQLAQGDKQVKVGAILESDYLLLEAQHATNLNNVENTRITLFNNLLALKVILAMDSKTTLSLDYPSDPSMASMGLLPPQHEVLERAMEVLPDLKINDYTIAAAQEGIKLAQSNYYPTVSLSGSVGNGRLSNASNFGAQFAGNAMYQQVGVSINIPIYTNNRNKLQVTKNRIQLKQAELDKMQTQLNLEQTIIEEYQITLLAYNKYKTNDISQNAFLRTFEAYSAKFNAGAITTVDLVQQQNNYISALQNYIQSKYEFVLNRKMLDVYMGVPVKM